MASHQSTGLHPRRAAWVDTAAILTPDAATAYAIGTGGDDVNFVFYFSSDAAGYVNLNDQADNLIVKVTAPSGGGRVLIERDGYELLKNGVTGLKLETTIILSAGRVQASVF